MAELANPHEHLMGKVVEITAPVGEPPGHTKFWLMSCSCGLCEFFPLDNFLLTSIEWQMELITRIYGEGYRVTCQPLVKKAREMVQNGAGHECSEWIELGKCLLCSQRVQ